MISKMRTSTLLAVMLALVLAPAAMAQSGAQLDGYSDEAGQVQDQVASQGGPGDEGGEGDVAPVAVSGDPGGGSDSALPFTGLDLALIGIAGAALLLLGVGLRRLTRAPQPSS